PNSSEPRRLPPTSQAVSGQQDDPWWVPIGGECSTESSLVCGKWMKGLLMFQRFALLVSLSLVCFAPLSADDTKPNDKGFVSLFDGKTLDGWAGAKEAYKVEDGSIVCVPGTAGNLLTEK